jgi:circadian clock protein KaiB
MQRQTSALQTKPSKCGRPRYVLQLFVVGTTPASSRAVVNIRKLCEQHLPGRYELQVIDLANNPEVAATAQIIAAPTLIKQLPAPIRRFIGDMSNTDRILLGLDIQPLFSEKANRS